MDTAGLQSSESSTCSGADVWKVEGVTEHIYIFKPGRILKLGLQI
jgi:hypothetical protein